MSTLRFLPIEFEIPEKLETNRMRLRMLQITDVIKDYDAVMSSKEHILKSKTFGTNQKWPTGLTIEQNLIDLGWHQKEFQNRSSFAYTVMSLDEIKCIGCIYIDPSTNSNYEAMVYMWVRQNEVDSGLDQHLFETVTTWISEKWPFQKVAYPGRTISWKDWRNQ